MSYNNLTRKALARLFVPLALAWLPASGYAVGVGASAPPSFNGPNYERQIKPQSRMKAGKVVASPARVAEDITVDNPYSLVWDYTVEYGSYYELLCATEGAQIYYTFDESWSNWTAYENPGILINEEVINNEGFVNFWAKAELDGYESGIINFYHKVRVSSSYTSPESGSKVQPGDEIKLLCDTPGAEIHYYLNGGEQQVYDPANPILVEEEYISNGQFKITSWATREGYDGSWWFDFDYIVNIPGVVMAPYSSIDSYRSIEPGTQIYLYCATEGAQIYYTFDGSFENWTPYYYDGITINSEDFNEHQVTIWAKAELDGVESDVVPFTYYERLPRVTAIPENGTTIALGDKIELFCENGDAEICYILNYDWDNEYKYNAAEGIVITEDKISYDYINIKAYAKLEGYAQSEYTYLYYNVATQPQGVAEPTASIESMSAVNPGTQVELLCEDCDYIIYKTAYDADWTGYSEPISINEDVTIWAVAGRYIEDNVVIESPEVSFTYKIVLPPTANPMSGSTVKPGDLITLSCDTPEAEIYYTFEPDYSQWIPYDNAGIIVNESDATNGKISFYAYTTLPGYSAYNTWWFEYTLENQEQPQVATPIALINGDETTGGIVAYDSYVELSCATPDAQICYWITDSEGNWSTGDWYQGPIQLSQYANAYRQVEISFYATRDGYADSKQEYLTFTLEEQKDRVSAPIALINGQETWGGDVPYDTSVNFWTNPQDATIYCNINGTGYDNYALPIELSQYAVERQVSIEVYASCEGYDDSDVYNYIFTLENAVASPVASIGENQVIAPGTKIYLTCATEGAQIWYGNQESYVEYVPAEGIVIGEGDSSVTFMAKAVLDGNESELASFTYQVDQNGVTPPTDSENSAAPGYVEPGTSIELTCATAYADIYYTFVDPNPRRANAPLKLAKEALDTQSPWDGWVLYNEGEGIRIDEAKKSIWTKAIDENEKESAIVELTYYVPQVSTPVAYINDYPALNGQEVPYEASVTFSCEPAEATIFYSINNGNFEEYDKENPIKLVEEGTITIALTASCDGYIDNYNTYTFTVEKQQQEQVATPIALINGYETTGGLVAYDSYVELSCATPDAQIWYRITDSEGEWTGEFLYEGPIQLSQYANAYREVSIDFYATCDGYQNSEPNSYSFTLEEQPQVAIPMADVPSGEVAYGTAVTFTCATEGAEIWININDTEWELYSEPIIVEENMVILAYTTCEGYSNSPTLVFTYTTHWIPTQDQASKPTASIPSGTAVEAGTEVELSCETPGAQIWYTLDGSNPRNSETRVLYENPIVIDKTMTIRSVATIDGYYDSMVAEFRYRVKEPAAKPEASLPQESEVDAGTSVELTSESEGAEIWYTLDGTSPITSETRIRYEQGIVIYEETTILAVAIGEDYLNSEVAEYHYTVKVPSGIYGVTGDKLTVATLPGGNGIQVAGVNGRSVVVYVFDTTGKAAMPNREISEDTVIPMDNCAPGVYVVKAVAADEVATLKLNLR